MTRAPEIIVLSGGISEERAVSLSSGRAAVEALEKRFAVRLIEIEQAILPTAIDPQRSVVFPALHGTFGEDGSIQQLMDAANIHYAGSDARASRLCFDKEETKKLLKEQGINVPPGLAIEASRPSSSAEIIDRLGEQLIMKPTCQGSSIGLHLIQGRHDLEKALSGIECGRWLIEVYLKGRELSVGVVEGEVLGLVEVIPESGVYDYEHKYTANKTRYDYPAKLSLFIQSQARALTKRIFNLCGCRDFARIDFILTPDEKLFALEVNTLPGLTPSSLLPKSASCAGYSFDALMTALVQPAIRRFQTNK